MPNSKMLGKKIFQDDMDLLSFTKWLIELRIFGIVGGVVGAIIAILVIYFKAPVTYVSRVSVLIDPASLPAATEPERVIKGVNAALITPEYAVAAFRELTEAMKLNDSSKADAVVASIIKRQSVESLIGTPIRLLDMAQAADSFLVELRLPFDGLKGQVADVTAKMLNAVVKLHNEEAFKRGTESTKTFAQDALKAFEKADGNPTTEHQVAVLNAQTDLSRLDVSIFNKIVASNIASRKVNYWMHEVSEETFAKGFNVRGDEVAKVLVSAGYKIELFPNADFSRMLKGVALLREEKKISEKESSEMLKNIAQARENFYKARSLAVAEMQERQSAVEQILEVAASKAKPMKRDEKFLPLFNVSAELAKISEVGGLYENPQSVRKVLFISIVVISIVIGLAVGAIRDALTLDSRKHANS